MYSVSEQGGGPFNTNNNNIFKSRNQIAIDLTNKETILSSSQSYIRPSVQE